MSELPIPTLDCTYCGKPKPTCDELGECWESFPQKQARRWGVKPPMKPGYMYIEYQNVRHVLGKLKEE